MDAYKHEDMDTNKHVDFYNNIYPNLDTDNNPDFYPDIYYYFDANDYSYIHANSHKNHYHDGNENLYAN